MTKPADKWMQKAREIVANGMSKSMTKAVLSGEMDTRIDTIIPTARALEAVAEAEKNRIGELLKDPAFVNANIMRGGIVLPSNYVRTTDTDGPYKAALEATDKAATERAAQIAKICANKHDKIAADMTNPEAKRCQISSKSTALYIEAAIRKGTE